jgi:hypothetical protein
MIELAPPTPTAQLCFGDHDDPNKGDLDMFRTTPTSGLTTNTQPSSSASSKPPQAMEAERTGSKKRRTATKQQSEPRSRETVARQPADHYVSSQSFDRPELAVRDSTCDRHKEGIAGPRFARTALRRKYHRLVVDIA